MGIGNIIRESEMPIRLFEKAFKGLGTLKSTTFREINEAGESISTGINIYKGDNKIIKKVKKVLASSKDPVQIETEYYRIPRHKFTQEHEGKSLITITKEYNTPGYVTKELMEQKMTSFKQEVVSAIPKYNEHGDTLVTRTNVVEKYLEDGTSIETHTIKQFGNGLLKDKPKELEFSFTRDAGGSISSEVQFKKIEGCSVDANDIYWPTYFNLYYKKVAKDMAEIRLKKEKFSRPDLCKIIPTIGKNYYKGEARLPKPEMEIFYNRKLPKSELLEVTSHEAKHFAQFASKLNVTDVYNMPPEIYSFWATSKNIGLANTQMTKSYNDAFIKSTQNNQALVNGTISPQVYKQNDSTNILEINAIRKAKKIRKNYKEKFREILRQFPGLDVYTLMARGFEY